MPQNKYDSMNTNATEIKNESINDSVTDSNNQVRPDGLRGCKCDELSPTYKRYQLKDGLSLVHASSPLSPNFDGNSLVSHCPKIVQHLHSSIAENRGSLKNETCAAEAKLPKERSFVPPQGTDAGQYPKPLFYQYYPKRNEGYTFDVLPLPFMERLKYQQMHALSMDNEDIQEKWNDFVYNLPNSQFQVIPYPDDKFWRWKNYLRYMPNENKNEFRYKMQTGPKYDSAGRLPITGEDLQIFRKTKSKKKTDVKHFLRKGDGRHEN